MHKDVQVQREPGWRKPPMAATLQDRACKALLQSNTSRQKYSTVAGVNGTRRPRAQCRASHGARLYREHFRPTIGPVMSLKRLAAQGRGCAPRGLSVVRECTLQRENQRV